MAAQQIGASVAPAAATKPAGQVSDSKADENRGTVFLGTDQAVLMPPAREPIIFYGDSVTLNFEEAPLSEVVHSILGDILLLDYIVEHPVKGSVTLRTRSPIPRDELLPILESLLHNHGALMVRGPDNRFFISGAQNASRMAPSFQSASGTGHSNVIVPLQHIGATEMAEILKPVATDRSFVRIDVKRNLLVLAGTQMQIEGWLDIVTTFDVDQLAGTSVGVFPIARGKVEDVFEELEHILNTAEGDVTGIASMVRVLPVERLNSILVVSPRAAYIEMVGNWVEQLDSIDEPAAESTLNVYEVLNGNAGQMAMLLSTIFAEDGSKGSSGAGKSQVAPGMQSQRSGGGGGGGGMPSTGAGQSMGGSSFELGESIRVVSDDYNNALLVYASPYEYGKIERILKKLDVVATQVLIEASIVEVQLVDGLQYGLEWIFQNGIGSDYSGKGTLDLLGGAGLSTIAPGFSYEVSNSAGDMKAVVNALAEESLVNVISTPSVLVLDNHTAAIHVGDQQPIQSMVSVTDGGVAQTSIEYKDTGVKLVVTPSVNDGGLVTLDIQQSVTDVGPEDSATGQRSFTEREVSSRIAVRSGDSVVLGGLIRDNDAKSKSGVPLLMDIPVLGSLFSTTSNTLVRTELLIFITPRVVETDDELRALSLEMRDRMKGLTDFDDVPVDLGPRDPQ
jgi:general secretion pathway protein D